MRPRTKTFLGFFLIMVGHYTLTLGCLLFSFGVTMKRFDAVRQTDMIETMTAIALALLAFPTMPLLEITPIQLPGLLGHLPFLANSALWAYLILLLISRRRKRNSDPSSQTTVG